MSDDCLLCSKCHVIKPMSAFSKSSKNIHRQGYEYRCKDCVRAASKTHYRRNIARISVQHFTYRVANKARFALYKKGWLENNLDRVNAASRKRYHSRDPEENRRRNAKDRALLLERHPTYMNDYQRKWSKQHPEKKRANDRLNRQRHPEKQAEIRRAKDARKRHAPINDLSHAQWEEIQAVQDHRCYYCDKRCKGQLTQDHIIALIKGGSHTVSNVIGACRSCNSKKHTGAPPVPVQPLLLTIAPARTKRRTS